MAKRWFIAPVIGTGTRADPYRAKVHDYGVPHSAMIPSNADGTPKFAWCICIASATNFSAIDADAAIDGFPEAALDRALGSFSAAVRNRVQNFLTNRGVDLTGITLSSTLADLLDRVRDRLDDRCDRRNMDVP